MNKRIKKKHRKKAMQLFAQLCNTIQKNANNYSSTLQECRKNYVEHLRTMIKNECENSSYTLKGVQLSYNESENTVEGTVTLIKYPTEFEIILENK